ncbi:MAG: alpha/beta hydrolase [Bacteriovoracia bacterium]
MKALLLVATFAMTSYAWAKPLTMTTAATAPTKQCDTDSLESCFQDRTKANHAFEMLHRDEQGNIKRTKKVALLIHGLSDSPYFYRDIAQILFKQGINVIATRTTGHGTDKTHLKNVTKEMWYEDVKFGMQKARELGDEILLGGMSLGGALVLREALINKDVKGLLLFSPAYKLPKDFNNTCRLENRLQRPFIRLVGRIAGLDTDDYQAKKEFGVDVRYQGIHNNGTCELIHVNKEIEKIARKQVGKKAELFSNLDIPIFNVISEYDTAIDLPYVSSLSKNAKSNERGLSHLVVYSKAEATPGLINEARVTFRKNVPCMRHASVLLRPSVEMNYVEAKCEFTTPEEIKLFNSESKYDFTPEINFEFDFMEEKLVEFIEQLP